MTTTFRWHRGTAHPKPRGAARPQRPPAQSPHSRTVQSWARLRGRHLGAAAFLINRIAGLLLVGYLYLHLGVLFLLTQGPGSWSAVLGLFKNPYFLALESVLILAILVHGLNGLRLALVGSGLAVRHQKILFVAAISAAVVLITAAVITMFGT